MKENSLIKIIEDRAMVFDKEFVDKRGKSLTTWELNEKARLNPLLVKYHHLSSILSLLQEIQRWAIKEVPKFKIDTAGGERKIILLDDLQDFIQEALDKYK
jgi:hypothetical protein